MIISTPLDSWPRKIFRFLDRNITHVSILSEKFLKHIVQQNDMVILEEKKYAPFPIFKKLPRIPAQIELFMRKK
jgi:hypothetical protein